MNVFFITLFNLHPIISTSQTDPSLRNMIQHANTRLFLIERDCDITKTTGVC